MSSTYQMWAPQEILTYTMSLLIVIMFMLFKNMTFLGCWFVLSCDVAVHVWHQEGGRRNCDTDVAGFFWWASWNSWAAASSHRLHSHKSEIQDTLNCLFLCCCVITYNFNEGGGQALGLASWVQGSDFCAMWDVKTSHSFICLIDISS